MNENTSRMRPYHIYNQFSKLQQCLWSTVSSRIVTNSTLSLDCFRPNEKLRFLYYEEIISHQHSSRTHTHTHSQAHAQCNEKNDQLSTARHHLASSRVKMLGNNAFSRQFFFIIPKNGVHREHSVNNWYIKPLTQFSKRSKKIQRAT